MEDVSLNWPLEGKSVEPLRPLTPEIIDNNELSSINFNLDKPKTFFNHFDILSKAIIETDPFDWFSYEKSINLPIVQDLQIPIHNEISSSSNPLSNYTSEYKRTAVPSNYAINVSPTGTAQTQFTYAPCYDEAVSMSVSSTDVVVPTPLSSLDIVPHQQAVLTPPDSPKDDDLMKLLDDIEPEDWDKLLSQSENMNHSGVSDNAFSIDELSDYAALSPYLGSENGSDYSVASPYVGSENNSNYAGSSPCASSENGSDYAASTPSFGSENGSDDSDYSPPSKIKRVGESTERSTLKSQNSKPRKEHVVKDRKLRKKEQNKNAATRYRMKKKQELEVGLSEERKMQDRNSELHTQLDELTREMKCLKSLMRDIFRKKGLIK